MFIPLNRLVFYNNSEYDYENMGEEASSLTSDLIRRLQSTAPGDNNGLASIFWEAKDAAAFPITPVPDTRGDTLLTISDNLFLLQHRQDLPEGYAGNKPDILYKLIPSEEAEPLLLKAKTAAENALSTVNKALAMLHSKI